MESDFVRYTSLIGIVVVCSILRAYRRTKDPFHPTIFIGAQLLFLYCWLPAITFYDIGLHGYLTVKQAADVQLINLIGSSAFCLGLMHCLKRPPKYPFYHLADNSKYLTRIVQLAKATGLVGVGAFAWIVVRSGGLEVTYGHSYGGGWHPLGYVRELYLLTIPAIIWYYLATAHRKLRFKDFYWLGLFSSPLLIHGLLGARRGPSLVIILTLSLAFYLSRLKRPPLLLVLKAGFILGFLILLLVSNRSKIFIGSNQSIENKPLQVFATKESNEFIYGAATIINAKHYNRYHYGLRYLTVLFIRPVPRAIWPNKYKDASAWFGIPDIEKNMGTGAADFVKSVGWKGAVGSAPGIIADTWIEFYWGSVAFLYLLGRMFSMFWRKATTYGGAWIVVYVLSSALSVYLITQTFEAMIFRFVFMVVPTICIWKLSKSKLGLPNNKAFSVREPRKI